MQYLKIYNTRNFFFHSKNDRIFLRPVPPAFKFPNIFIVNPSHYHVGAPQQPDLDREVECLMILLRIKLYELNTIVFVGFFGNKVKLNSLYMRKLGETYFILDKLIMLLQKEGVSYQLKNKIAGNFEDSFNFFLEIMEIGNTYFNLYFIPIADSTKMEIQLKRVKDSSWHFKKNRLDGIEHPEGGKFITKFLISFNDIGKNGKTFTPEDISSITGAAQTNCGCDIINYLISFFL